MLFKRWIKMFALLALLVGVMSLNVAGPDSAQAGPGNTQASKVYAPFGCEIGVDCEKVGTATLTRSGTPQSLGKVCLKGRTTDLVPDSAYTMWWVVFNHPEECSGGVCGEDDLFNAPVETAVLWATGFVTDDRGKARFGEVCLQEGEHRDVDEGQAPPPFAGTELVDALGAEIHIVVRGHGPADADPDILHAQLTELNGGCPPNVCDDEQFILFIP